MPVSIQQTPKGPVYVIECGCCGRDIRVLTKAVRSLRKAIAQWGCVVAGCYNGRWELICDLCREEAKTGKHVGGWRW